MSFEDCYSMITKGKVYSQLGLFFKVTQLNVLKQKFKNI